MRHGTDWGEGNTKALPGQPRRRHRPERQGITRDPGPPWSSCSVRHAPQSPVPALRKLCHPPDPGLRADADTAPHGRSCQGRDQPQKKCYETDVGASKPVLPRPVSERRRRDRASTTGICRGGAGDTSTPTRPARGGSSMSTPGSRAVTTRPPSAASATWRRAALRPGAGARAGARVGRERPSVRQAARPDDPAASSIRQPRSGVEH